MTSPERRPSALDANGRDEAPEATGLGLAEAAEAEAAAAEAEARAVAARARAIRLRREADSMPYERSPDADPAESSDADAQAGTPSVDASRPRRLRRPSTKAMAVCAGIVLLCAALAASGYMFRQDRMALQERRRAAAYAAAARQDVAALMSLDVNKAKEDMQRIADNSTGNFKNSFPMIAEQLTKGWRNLRSRRL